MVGTGTIKLSAAITLKSVVFVPELDCNLISVSKLTRDLNCVTKLLPNSCIFQDLSSGKMIGKADMQTGLYVMDVNTLLTQLVSHQNSLSHSFKSSSQSNKESDIMLWHFRLGHPNFSYLKRLLPSLFINKNPKLFKCEVCQMAKHTRNTYSPRSYKPSHPFSLVYGDIWGPVRIPSITGARWFLLLVDDHTRLCWTFLMKDKSETKHIFQHFHVMVQNQFNAQIQIPKTDNAKDFFNSSLSFYLQSHGVVQQSSCAHTPQQNGVAERKNRHILEVARSLLFQGNVPTRFWGEAILTATYLINRMPSRVLDFHSPLEKFQGIFPTSHLVSQVPFKLFGCSAFVHIYPQYRGKLDARALKCILLGYSANQKGYKCFSPTTRKFYNTMDVTFFEDIPFYPNYVIQGENNIHEFQNWDWTYLMNSDSPTQVHSTLSPPSNTPTCLEPDLTHPVT